MTTTTTTALGPLQAILVRRRPDSSNYEQACMATIERAIPPEVMPHLQTRLAIIEAEAETGKPQCEAAHAAVIILGARILTQVDCGDLWDNDQWREALTNVDLRTLEQYEVILHDREGEDLALLRKAINHHIWAAVFFDAMNGAAPPFSDAKNWRWHLEWMLHHIERSLQSIFTIWRQRHPYGQLSDSGIENVIPMLEDSIGEIILHAVQKPMLDL